MQVNTCMSSGSEAAVGRFIALRISFARAVAVPPMLLIAGKGCDSDWLRKVLATGPAETTGQIR